MTDRPAQPDLPPRDDLLARAIDAIPDAAFMPAERAGNLALVSIAAEPPPHRRPPHDQPPAHLTRVPRAVDERPAHAGRSSAFQPKPHLKPPISHAKGTPMTQRRPAPRPSPRGLADAVRALQPDLGDLHTDLDTTLALIDIAENEIRDAQDRHGEPEPVRNATGKITSETGPLWRAFPLLRPTGTMDAHAPFVYREHCRELLERVAHAEDTRPPTGPEMILTLSAASHTAPLNGAAFGLYLRLFHRTFPDHARTVFSPADLELADYERMYGSRIDDHQRLLDRKLRQDWRMASAVGLDAAA